MLVLTESLPTSDQVAIIIDPRRDKTQGEIDPVKGSSSLQNGKDLEIMRPL